MGILLIKVNNKTLLRGIEADDFTHPNKTLYLNVFFYEWNEEFKLHNVCLEVRHSNFETNILKYVHPHAAFLKHDAMDVEFDLLFTESFQEKYNKFIVDYIER